MDEDKEEKGFVIRDKRGRTADEPSPASSAPGMHANPSALGKMDADHPISHEADESRPPVNFASFIFSLGSSALMLMGEPLAPGQQNPPVNLPQAKEIIDILSMLEEKTKGNLLSEETTVLADMLYALRLKYVDLVSGKKSSASS